MSWQDVVVAGEAGLPAHSKRVPSKVVVEGGNITVLCLATGESHH